MKEENAVEFIRLNNMLIELENLKCVINDINFSFIIKSPYFTKEYCGADLADVPLKLDESIKNDLREIVNQYIVKKEEEITKRKEEL